MYDLDPAELSKHELRVLKSLSDFITYHQPGSSLSAIDNIVLMYVVGVLEDVGNDDDFDAESFIEMIASYVPGFQSMDVAVVYDWIFELTGKLKKEGSDDQLDVISEVVSGLGRLPQDEGTNNSSIQLKSEDESICSEAGTFHPDTEATSEERPAISGNFGNKFQCSNSSKTEVRECLHGSDKAGTGEDEELEETLDTITSSQDSLLSSELEDKCKEMSLEDSGIGDMKFTPGENDHHQMIREIVPDASDFEITKTLAYCGGDLEQAVEMLVEKMTLEESKLTLEESRGGRKEEKSSQSLQTPIIFKSKLKNKEQKKRRRSKHQKENGDKKSSQEEIPDPERQKYRSPSAVNEDPESKDCERSLLELFPAASRVDAQQCLSVAKGDLEVAVQLLMEKVNSGDIQGNSVMDKFPRSKVTDDKTQRQLLLQKYAFVDADEHTKEHRPFLPKPEKRKLVRYYDSRPVTNKGEKYFETKNSE